MVSIATRRKVYSFIHPEQVGTNAVLYYLNHDLKRPAQEASVSVVSGGVGFAGRLSERTFIGTSDAAGWEMQERFTNPNTSTVALYKIGYGGTSYVLRVTVEWTV